MTKQYLFKTLAIIYGLLVSVPAVAHTINQDMEQMYGTAYLPIFIYARLLPFVGLGLLSFDAQKNKSFQVHWPFFMPLIFGIALGFVWHGGHFISMFNNVGIIAIGLLLLFINSSANKYVLALFLGLGLTIGYENGLFIAHSGHFRWMYLSILGCGVCLFLILNNIHFVGNPRRKIILNIAGIIFLISGIFIVLLS